MNAMRLLLPTALYTLSLTALMAMSLEPGTNAGLEIELGPTTVIGIETPASITEERVPPLVLREIG